MHNYKMVVALPSITHNGKTYVQGAEVFTQRLEKHEADIINRDKYLTGLKAVLVEEKKTELDLLKEEAKELGLNFPKNISEEKLQEKIDKFKSEQ